jgi:hypothetical protein
MLGRLKLTDKAIEIKSYTYFKNSTPKREDPHSIWLRPINYFSSSFYPHVVVVNEKEKENSISIDMDEIREDRTTVVFILHREGRYEPMGYINYYFRNKIFDNSGMGKNNNRTAKVCKHSKTGKEGTFNFKICCRSFI